VNLRLVATAPRDKPDLYGAAPRRGGDPSRRRARLDDGWQEVDVYERALLGVGSELQGPAVVEFAESTLLVRPGWRASVDEVGTLDLERRG
jgi:N-methylhydantoinase A